MKKRIWFCCAVVVFLMGFSLSVVQAGFEMPPDIKACDIVTGEEVAKLAGGKMLVKPTAISYFCNYVIEMNEGGVESYQLTFDSPDSTKIILENISSEEKGEKIDGVLDEAYLGKAFMSNEITLRALRRDKMGMNVSGARKEVVLKIARLAVTRLP
ncbi:MAG: hypothetical protein OEM01_14275 [Desulfobulbaceae bacterium]|nr:hypothetical protein [Desulfobulbaceae bacterium]